MKMFVVLKRLDTDDMKGTYEEFFCVRTALPAAMVAAHGVKPAVVLEVSTKPGDGDEPVERAEIK